MKKKLLGLSVIIIIIGIIIVAVKGFNVNLKYREHKNVRIAVGEEFNIKDIESIIKDVMGKESFKIETAGVFNDEVLLNVKDISNDQLESLATKLGEKYTQNKEIIIPINKDDYQVSDVEAIAKEVLNKGTVAVKKVEDNEGYVSIESNIITENKAQELIDRLNEKYEIDNSLKTVQVKKIINVKTLGRVTINDMAKQYLFYVLIATLLVIAYFVLIYRKLGVAKVLGESVGLILLSELLYFAIIAICRYPVDKLAIMASILIYISVIAYMNISFMKQLSENNKKNK